MVIYIKTNSGLVGSASGLVGLGQQLIRQLHKGEQTKKAQLLDWCPLVFGLVFGFQMDGLDGDLDAMAIMAAGVTIPSSSHPPWRDGVSQVTHKARQVGDKTMY